MTSEEEILLFDVFISDEVVRVVRRDVSCARSYPSKCDALKLRSKKVTRGRKPTDHTFYG